MKETNDEYHDDHTRLSNSMLGVLKRCPQEFQQRYVTKTMPQPKASEAMNVGSLVHCMVLEPDEVWNRYILRPNGIDGRTREGKLALEELRNSGRQVVTQEDYETALGCSHELTGHDQLSKLLDYDDQIIEERINFVCNRVEMRCKPDLVLPWLKVVVDIKTSSNASPGEFSKSVAAFGYARQAALYLEAVHSQYGELFRFLFAVVCTKPPFEVACYELTIEALRQGTDEAAALLEEYEVRCETNNWLPVWSSGIVPLDLPKWYRHEAFQIESGETV